MTVALRCVIDTNICIKLFVADPLTSKVNQLFTHLDDPSVEFFIPDLFYIECANVLWKYVRANLYTDEQVKADLSDLKALRFQVISTKDLMSNNDPLFLPEEVKESLSQQCDRLSEIEKQVISLLVAENNPVSLVKLLENSKIIPADLLNALQSLLRRSLIEKQENYYIILPLIKQYIASLNRL